MTSAPNTVPARLPSAPVRKLPEGACDVHCHVFGPLNSFPTGPATYAIPLADPQVYRAMLDRAGLDRGVLIQPAPYGTDTRALMNALQAMGDRVRGIAVANADITDEQMAALNQAGVRGLRFIEMLDPTSGRRYAGSIGIDVLQQLAPRMKRLGWQAHLWAKAQDCPRIFDEIHHLDLPIVFDHMGQFDVKSGVESAAFQGFLKLLETGQVWTKLSLCRVSAEPDDYADVRAFHEALLDTRPDRLLWGSDWPFVRMGAASPDVGMLLDTFQGWAKSPERIKQILVDNPAELFGF